MNQKMLKVVNRTIWWDSIILMGIFCLFISFSPVPVKPIQTNSKVKEYVKISSPSDILDVKTAEAEREYNSRLHKLYLMNIKSN